MLSCFFQGILELLPAQERERPGDPRARVRRKDHFIDEAPLGDREGVGETGFILLGMGFDLNRVVEFAAEENLDGTLRTHHRDLGGWPRKVDIAAKMLGTHDVVGAAIGLAGDHRNLGHRGFREGEEELGAVLDDAAVLLGGAGQKPGHIDESQDGDRESVAEPDEAARLAARSDIEAACKHHGLVGDDAHRMAAQADEAGNDVPGEAFLDLAEVALVGDLPDRLPHIVGDVGVGGNERVEGHRYPVDGIPVLQDRWRLAVRERKEVEEPPHFVERFHVVGVGAVGNRADFGMGLGAPELLGGHHFVGHGLHHIGAGHEHVGGAADHEDEVGHRGGVDGTACAGPHDHGDLGDDAGCEDIPLEHLGVSGEGSDALLYAGAAGVIQSDDGGAVSHRHVHDLADLLRVGLGEGSAKDREVLAEHVDRTAMDVSPAGHNAVAGDALGFHTEVGAAVGYVGVELLEGALVEEDLDSLSGGQLAALMLTRNPLGAATEACRFAATLQILENVLHVAVPDLHTGPARYSGIGWMARNAKGSHIVLPQIALAVRPDFSLQGADTEGWPSGLRRTLGEREYRLAVSWVRIPPPPPEILSIYLIYWNKFGYLLCYVPGYTSQYERRRQQVRSRNPLHLDAASRVPRQARLSEHS